MSLDIGYVPGVLNSLYAEEDSAFYYVNPFEESSQDDRKFENSSIYMTNTSYDTTYGCTQIPERQSDLSSDSAFHPSDSNCTSFLSKSSPDYEFDLNEEVIDSSADAFCLFQKSETSSVSSEHSSGHARKRYLMNAVCEEQSPRGSLDADRPSKDSLHTCQQCGKSFKRNRNLKKHLENHSDATNFNCEICKRQFRLKSELRRHMLVHSVENPHTCHHCGKLFKTKRFLKRHLKVHDSKRSFSCEICDDQFHSEKQLEEHVTDHPEVKMHLKQCQLERSLERSFHCKEEHSKGNGTPEFHDLTHLSQDLSSNDAGTEATRLSPYRTFPQIQSSNYLELDDSMTFGAGNPIHVVSTSSGFHMAPTSDGRTMTSDFWENLSVNEDWITSLFYPSHWEEVNRTTDNPSVMHSDHFLTSP